MEGMGQETRTLFSPLRYHQDGSLADAGGDDEAPYGTSHRIRQAPVWGSPDSGENVVDAFSVMISVCPFDSVAVCFRILVKFVIFCDFADTLYCGIMGLR